MQAAFRCNLLYSSLRGSPLMLPWLAGKFLSTILYFSRISDCLSRIPSFWMLPSLFREFLFQDNLHVDTVPGKDTILLGNIIRFNQDTFLVPFMSGILSLSGLLFLFKTSSYFRISSVSKISPDPFLSKMAFLYKILLLSKVPFLSKTDLLRWYYLCPFLLSWINPCPLLLPVKWHILTLFMQQNQTACYYERHHEI